MRTLFILICIHGIGAWDMVLQGPGRVDIGQRLSLSCNASDLESAPTAIVWFKGYDKLLPGDRISVTSLESRRAITSKLTINNVSKQDQGKYKCWLSNQMIRQLTVTVVDHSQTGADSGSSGQFPTAFGFIFFVCVNILFCK